MLEKRQILQQKVLRKLVIYMQKTEARLLSLTLPKESVQNGSKILMEDLKLCNYYGKTLEDTGIDKYFLNRTPVT
jgi:hypothetical protein